MAACTNYGNRAGARELLRKIVQKPPGWFSTFLDVLRQTEHFDMVCELTGLESTEDHKRKSTIGMSLLSLFWYPFWLFLLEHLFIWAL